MRYFCTYFDSYFLPRALALHESLARWCPEFRLWTLCMDDASCETVRRLDLPGVQAISLPELERADPDLARAKENRSPVEYCYTCSPALPLHVLGAHPEVDLLTYLDADLFFYADPQPIYDELEGASIGIIPHQYSRRVADRACFGRYNVGWISFRRDNNGLACLEWWRERCLEWCYARLEGNRYADQKYLDEWPARFGGVREIRHRGANLGPWNLGDREVKERNGQVVVDGDPLLFFHFSSFLQVAPWLYNTNLLSWGVRPSRVVRRRIIGPYIEALQRQAGGLPGGAPPARIEARAAESRSEWLRRKLRAVQRISGGLLAQDHLLFLRGRVL